jgi:hypothetical protein
MGAGVEMFLSDPSLSMMWLLLLGAAVLGLMLLYGMTRTGRMSRREWREIERNTEIATSRDDPHKGS